MTLPVPDWQAARGSDGGVALTGLAVQSHGVIGAVGMDRKCWIVRHIRGVEFLRPGDDSAMY